MLKLTFYFFSDPAEKYIKAPPSPTAGIEKLQSIKKSPKNIDLARVTFTLGNESFTRMMTCSSPKKRQRAKFEKDDSDLEESYISDGDVNF